jgi:hypothetical protein
VVSAAQLSNLFEHELSRSQSMVQRVAIEQSIVCPQLPQWISHGIPEGQIALLPNGSMEHTPATHVPACAAQI